MKSVDRPIKERSRQEIESQMTRMGDYVKMSYLQRALKSGLDFDTKKFVMVKLADIYEQRRIYLEAAKLVRSAAEINTTFKDKINDFMRSVGLFVKSGDFIEADRVFAQALALGNEREKMEMKTKYKNFYLEEAKGHYNSGRRKNAKEFYEKALKLDLEPGERAEVNKKLLEMYEKLGHVKEYMSLRKTL